MRSQIAIACVAVLLGCAASSSAQTVSLQFDNGLVTVNAQNAPVRTILAEWSRLGGTRFLNADRIGGAPLDIDVQLETQSILARTLVLFATTAVAALATLALVIWWIARRGQRVDTSGQSAVGNRQG